MILRNLDPGTTIEELRKYLFEAGINVPESHLSIKHEAGFAKASAVVVLEKDQVISLMRRALMDETGNPKSLRGNPVYIRDDKRQ